MTLHVNDAVIWQETENGVSLYHAETGDFLTLNETGTQIWILAANDGDRESVITKLALLFGGGNPAIGSRIRADVEEFISAMVDRGILTESVKA